MAVAQCLTFECEKDCPPRSTIIAEKMEVFGRLGSTFELSVGLTNGQLIWNPHAKCNRSVLKSGLYLV